MNDTYTLADQLSEAADDVANGRPVYVLTWASLQSLMWERRGRPWRVDLATPAGRERAARELREQAR